MYSAATTSNSQKLNKIKDLLDVNATRSVDLIGIIANIGRLQEINVNQETMRDIYLFDDSWAMVKMVVRSSLNAIENENLEQYQILSVRNVQAIKRKDHMYLITTPGTTELTVLDNTPRAIALNQWFFGSDLLMQGFDKFFNLSSNSSAFGNNNSNLTHAQKNSDKQKETPKQQKIKNKGLKNGHSSSSEEPPVKIKCIKPDAESPEQKVNIKNAEKIKQEVLSDPELETQVNAESKTEDSVQNRSTFEMTQNGEVENQPENTDNNNAEDNKEEKCLKSEIQNEVKLKSEVESNNQVKIQDSDSDEKDLTIVNFKNLMESKFFSQKLEWSQQQDKVLINFVINNPDMDFKSNTSYEQLLMDKPDIFEKQTTESLQNRLKTLGNVENYLYLLQVCGGKNLKTEKEKNSFLSNVETLRSIMGCKPKDNDNVFNNLN